MRYRLATLGVLALVPIAALVGWWLMSEPRITEANCERIHKGMTLAQVEAILGPPGFEVPAELPGYIAVGVEWEHSGAVITVWFEDGCVQSALFQRLTVWERFDAWWHGEMRSPGSGKRLQLAV